MDLKVAIETIYKALDAANKSGVYTLEESSTIMVCYNAIANEISMSASIDKNAQHDIS